MIVGTGYTGASRRGCSNKRMAGSSRQAQSLNCGSGRPDVKRKIAKTYGTLGVDAQQAMTGLAFVQGLVDGTPYRSTPLLPRWAMTLPRRKTVGSLSPAIPADNI